MISLSDVVSWACKLLLTESALISVQLYPAKFALVSITLVNKVHSCFLDLDNSIHQP